MNYPKVLIIILFKLTTWDHSMAYKTSRDRRFLMDTDVISCDFESMDFCGYTQDNQDDFSWTWNKGSTASGQTGPTYDHTFNDHTGHYIYTEASHPRLQGDKARLISRQSQVGSLSQLVEFYFHMYGSSMGTLNVYVESSQAQSSPAFTISGNHGDKWKYGCVNLPTNSTYKVIFEGIIGSSYYGDIAIDDIKLKTGRCSGQHLTTGHTFTASTISSLIALNSLSCDFEQGFCGYTQDKTDQRDWYRHVGNTSSVATGPQRDHTVPLGTGHYIYFESSNPVRFGDKARILSPLVSSSHGTGSVRFWYHMYGADMGTFSVYIKQGNLLGNPVLSVSGNHGNTWKQGCIEVPSSLTQFQLVFEGTRGWSFHGDMAIDDITWSNSQCTSTIGHTTISKTTNRQTTFTQTTPHLSTQTTTDPGIIFVSIDVGSQQTTSSTFITSKSPGSVDGSWSPWSAYTSCSKTCERGTRRSHRLCNNPAPSGGGNACAGASTKYQLCQLADCQVDGSWSSWTAWSKCSTTCGLGSIARIRKCSNPAPSGGGRNCSGDAIQTHDCTTGPCAVWSSWYSGPCSVSCGNGTMEQFRHCSSGHDEDCTGSPFQQVPCTNPRCI